MPSPPSGRTFRVARPDGAEIHVEIEGKGRSTLVLCDGLACDGFAWKYLLPVLAEHHRVVHWHYRGHGQSPLPPPGVAPSIPQFVEDLAAVLDGARVRNAVIVGHSMGVQLALEFHRLHPGQTRALILVSGSPGHPLDTFHDTTLLRRALPSLRKGAERFPRMAAALTRVGVRSGLAMEVAMSTEVNASLLRRADLQPYFEHVERMDPRYSSGPCRPRRNTAPRTIWPPSMCQPSSSRETATASLRPGSRGGWRWRSPPPSCSWCEVGATPRFWNDRRK